MQNITSTILLGLLLGVTAIGGYLYIDSRENVTIEAQFESSNSYNQPSSLPDESESSSLVTGRQEAPKIDSEADLAPLEQDSFERLMENEIELVNENIEINLDEIINQ